MIALYPDRANYQPFPCTPLKSPPRASGGKETKRGEYLDDINKTSRIEPYR